MYQYNNISNSIFLNMFSILESTETYSKWFIFYPGSNDVDFILPTVQLLILLWTF